MMLYSEFDHIILNRKVYVSDNDCGRNLKLDTWLLSHQLFIGSLLTAGGGTSKKKKKTIVADR